MALIRKHSLTHFKLAQTKPHSNLHALHLAHGHLGLLILVKPARLGHGQHRLLIVIIRLLLLHRRDRLGRCSCRVHVQCGENLILVGEQVVEINVAREGDGCGCGCGSRGGGGGRTGTGLTGDEARAEGDKGGFVALCVGGGTLGGVVALAVLGVVSVASELGLVCVEGGSSDGTR